MNILAAPHGLKLRLPSFLETLATHVQPVARAATPVDWLERLARWAEHQPMHHHFGSSDLLR